MSGGNRWPLEVFMHRFWQFRPDKLGLPSPGLPENHYTPDLSQRTAPSQGKTMAIVGLNHFNIVAPTQLMARVRDFYVDVLGLAEGYRPDFGIPGYWLYAGENALVHLVDGGTTGSTSGAASGTGTGHLDHIAFTATDLDGTESCLKARGWEYKKIEYPDFHLTQLFTHDPIGLGVEMNFAT